jgi:hypothetical protein
MYVITPGQTYGEAIEAYQAELHDWGGVIDRVADLFMRFDTTQAEIAATVHFAARRLVDVPENRRPNELEVFEAVKAWKMRRRPPLNHQDVARMIRSLNVHGWVDLEPSADLPLPDDVFADEFDMAGT